MSETPRGFQPDQSANDVHRALKSALVALEKAQQCAVLWFGKILDRKLYREFGYSSINRYAKVELGFSSSRTGDFLQLSRKLKKLPMVKAKVESGELGYTAARVIAPGELLLIRRRYTCTNGASDQIISAKKRDQRGL